MTTTTAEALTVPLLPGSPLAPIHRESGPLRRALTALPAWVDTVDALNHLETMRPPRRNLASLDVEMETLLTDAVDQRQPLDMDQALAHAGRVQNALSAHQALSGAFEQVTANLVQRLDNAVRANQAAIYAHLSRELNDVVQQAREHVDVIGLDAEAAITAGLTEPWREWQALRAECRALRAARGTLEQRLGWTDEYPNYGELRWVANPAQVYQHWRAWKVDGYLVNPANAGDRKPLRSPWPDPRAGRIGAAEEADAWLTFLARTPDAVAWIPDPRQYAKAAKALFEYASTLRPGDSRRAHVDPPPSPVTYAENTRPARKVQKGLVR